MKSHICVRLGDRGYSRQRFSSLQAQRPLRCREKNSASPRPLRFMTSDREPLLLETQRTPMKALPSNARLKLVSNPQNAFQSNYPVASPRKMANLQGQGFRPCGHPWASCTRYTPHGFPAGSLTTTRRRPEGLTPHAAPNVVTSRKFSPRTWIR